MPWIKAWHVVFMVTWFAGLFYLPRLFVYHASTTDAPGAQRFAVMERRLFVLMSIGGAATLATGLWLVARSPFLLEAGWLRTKLALVALLVAYHLACFKLMRDLARGASRRSARWFRAFNELPTLLLIGIVLLAVARPF